MTVVSSIDFLFSMYPHNGTQSDGMIAGYAMLLQDIPEDELQTVVLQCVAECKFVPTVAEIRDRWHDLNSDVLAGDAEEGWRSVQRAISGHGHTSLPRFRDPLTTKVVETMGWLEICASDNSMADRAHFLKIYGQYQARKVGVDKLLPGAKAMLAKAAPDKLLRMENVMQIAMNGAGD